MASDCKAAGDWVHGRTSSRIEPRAHGGCPLVPWGPRAGSTRVSARNLGLLPKSWRSFLQFSRGEQFRSNTPMIPRQRLFPLRTAPRLASRSALCGRALSTRTCTSPHHQPAAAAGSPLSKGEEYIVYGHDSNYADGGYTVGICSRTALLGQAQADIDALGEGNAPQAGTGGPAPRRTTRHATSKYRRLQPTGLGNSPGRGNRRSPGGWRRGPNGPQSTTQPTENGCSLLKLTSRGVVTAGSYR